MQCCILWISLKKRGFEITFLDVHENGIVSPAEVEEAIRPDTCLVTVMYANNEIGTVQPVGEIGAVCRKKGVLFHTDAVQAAGQLAIDTEAQKIDMLSLSAHKFHGPKGVGVLYIRRGIPAVSLIHGGGQERGKRAGTENTAGIAGMAAALQEACSRMQYNSSRIRSIRDGLLQELLKIPHSVLNGDRVRRLPGNIHMCFEGIEGESLILLLSERGICASSGSACTSGSLDPSPCSACNRTGSRNCTWVAAPFSGGGYYAGGGGIYCAKREGRCGIFKKYVSCLAGYERREETACCIVKR